MTKDYTMFEILREIDSTKAELEGLYKKYIDSQNSRCLVSLYNDSSNLTINGAKAEDVTSEIIQIDYDINHAIEWLKNLMVIKEQVNSMYTTTLVTATGVTSNFTVAQLLAISSPKIKKYHLDYINKLESDYQTALNAQASYSKSVMTDDKVSMYVNAKMNSLHITDDPDKATYGSFAREYKDANRMDILDPLDIRHCISDMKKNAIEYYDKIKCMITAFNVGTKIRIDIDESTGQCNYTVLAVCSDFDRIDL